jgi:hypothetical protein
VRQPPSEKLRFLADTVMAELALLQITNGRLFAVPMDAARAASLRQDIEHSEHVDAFVARFGRLHDTTADEPLPAERDLLSVALKQPHPMQALHAFVKSRELITSSGLGLGAQQAIGKVGWALLECIGGDQRGIGRLQGHGAM